MKSKRNKLINVIIRMGGNAIISSVFGLGIYYHYLIRGHFSIHISIFIALFTSCLVMASLELEK